MVDKHLADAQETFRPAPLSEPHIVDVLIEERAQKLRQRRVLWPLIRRFIYPVLRYRSAIDLADTIADRSGTEIMNWFSDNWAIDLDVSGAHHIPLTGPIIIASNHPTGMADGFAVYDALRRTRQDISMFANSDAVRVAPGFLDMLIPVEWVMEKRTPTTARRTVKHMSRAFRDCRAVILFPSGRVAYLSNLKLRDRPWIPTVISLARKYNAPIIPLYMSSRNSALYYLLSIINKELKDMTLFHEMLNKKASKYRLVFGPPIAPDSLTGDNDALAEDLRDYVENRLSQSSPTHIPAFME